MNQKGISSITIILIIVGVLVIAGGIWAWQSQKEKPVACTQEAKLCPDGSYVSRTGPNCEFAACPTTPVSEMPSLSVDKKSIVAGDKILLTIDNDTIFNWFKTKSQLCDGYNLTSTPDRKMFCENKTSFKNLTRFASIVVSPDKMKIGFTIESDTLSPDKVVGIFSRSANAVNLLGNYYLGNEFISFSPSGTNFVYQGGCFEAMCGLYIKNSETLVDRASLSDSEYADARTRTATFVRWLSDNEIEYKLGTELKRESF